MDKYIGRLLDNRYEILEVLGTGGMAVVYKARCHRLNRLVAIKILKDDFLEDEEFRRRFHSESQAVAMLSHPNIVSVYDVSTSITADYIVMELIDGITLKQYMEKKGVLNWKETLHFAIQIAKALEHAHSRGIVHRDIKPHNVMVLKNGSVKVTDFGIARMMSKGNTLTKEALGSVHYISPEQAKGGRVDNRSDIYSLGVVMYEMMSGRPPYDGESPVAVAIQHINGGAAMPSTLNPNIPGGLEQIIMKAMGHEPAQRYATASKMLVDLDEFRKQPAILFDYNTPPLDDVTIIARQPLVLDTPQTPVTTAEQVAARPEPERKTPAAPSQRTPQRRTPSGTPQRRPRKTQVEEKRNNIATIAIIACSIVMVVAVLIFFAVFFWDQPDLVTVPNLIGKTYDPDHQYTDFDIVVDNAFHDTYPEGQIIDQKPDAGDKIEKNGSIYITVSMGKAPDNSMPKLEGLELAVAEQALKNKQLKLDIVVEKENHDTIGEGNIIRTEPAADTQLQTGQTVTLYVSEGPEIKDSTMPQLVGSDEEQAIAALEDLKLELNVVVETDYDATMLESLIFKTEPEVGEKLTTGQKVTLYISLGPKKKQLIDVKSLDVAQATTTLLNAEFGNFEIKYVESEEDGGTVIEQYAMVDNVKVYPGTEEIPINCLVVLEVSKKQSQKPQVTKDVTIDLKGSTAAGECMVTVKREDTVVFEQLVEQNAASITIKDQVGSGDVYYEVMIGEDGWIQKETF